MKDYIHLSILRDVGMTLEVLPLIKRFEALDTAGSGELTHEDIQLMIEESQRELGKPPDEAEHTLRGQMASLLGSESRLRHIGIPSVLTPRHGKREDRRVEPCVDPTTMPTTSSTTSSLVRRNTESWAVG